MVSGGFGLAIFHFMSKMDPDGQFPPSTKDMPPEFSQFMSFFQYFSTLAILQIAMAAFSIFAAIQFLRLKPWSRNYFEAVNWLIVAWAVAFGVFFTFTWVRITSGIPDATAQGDFPAGLFTAFGLVGGIGGTLVNAAFPAASVWLLRSRFVRPAFTATRPERADPSV